MFELLVQFTFDLFSILRASAVSVAVWRKIIAKYGKMAHESETTRKFKFNVETVTEKSKAHTRPSGKRKSKQKVLFQGLLKYRKWIRYISNQPHDKCF